MLKAFAEKQINQSKKCKPAENIMKLKSEEVFAGGKIEIKCFK